MTHESSESEELFELVSELVDGGLTPARVDRLRALLRDDPEAQDLYLRFMRVHAQLDLDYNHGSGPVDMPGGSSMPLGPPSDRPLAGVGGPPFEAEFGEHGVGASPARFWPTASAIGWSLAVVLAIGLAVVLRSAGPGVPKAPPATARPLARRSVADGLAVVVRAATRWEMADGQVPVAGDILPKGRLQVHEGRAILAMLSGVDVIVEGPAEIELLSIDRIACNRGNLRARVPEGAEGFAISGPGSAVVDLGTEFGVNIKPDGKSRGKVFVGEVEAAVLGESGALRRSRVMKEESEAFEIDPGTGVIQPIKGPESFVSPFKPALAPLPLGPGYRDSVLRSRPRSYWRFESADGGAIANEIAGQPPLLVTGPIRIAGDAGGNRCAAFDAGQPDQRLTMDGLWKPERTPGYAIELWFLPERIHYAALASLISPRDTTDHLSLVELTSSNRRILFPPATVRFLYRWPTGRGGGDNAFSTAIYVPLRWHHLVAQVAGDRMELYLDGVAQASQAIDSDWSTSPSQLILGRLTTLSESPGLHHTGYRRAFIGLLDEVAVYDHPLPAEEIGARFRLAGRADAGASPTVDAPAAGFDPAEPVSRGGVPPRKPGSP